MIFLFGILSLVSHCAGTPLTHAAAAAAQRPVDGTAPANPIEVNVHVSINGLQVAEATSTSTGIPSAAGGSTSVPVQAAVAEPLPLFLESELSPPPTAMEMVSGNSLSSALVTLYDKENYEGDNISFNVTNECRSLPEYWQDRASSISSPTACTEFYILWNCEVHTAPPIKIGPAGGGGSSGLTLPRTYLGIYDDNLVSVRLCQN